MRRLWPDRLAWLPVPVLLAAMIVFWAAGLQTSHESLYLLLVINLVFSTLVCLVVAYLIARSFLVRGTPGLLLLGCGVVIWGPAGVVATVAARGDANTSITIYNCCVWLSGLCHLVGVSLSLRPKRSLAMPALWLPAAYALAIGGILLVTLAALAGWIPTFFVEERGGTPMRQVVLFSAALMFTLTSLLLYVTRRRSTSAFAYWYALALALIAVGLYGVMLQTYHASVLGWTGRATQALGGLYMLIAAIASVRESHVWEISLEKALLQSEQRYRTLVETAPDAIVVHRDGRFLYANSAALALAGLRSFEQLAHHTVFDFFRPEDREYARERTSRAAAGDRLPEWEATLLRPDGQEITVEFRTAPLDFRGGPAVLTIARDITERRRAEETLRRNEEFTRRLLASSADCIKVLDPDGRLLAMNEAGQRLQEIDDLAPYLNTCWVDFWRVEDRPRVREALARAKSTGMGAFSACCTSAKGTNTWWDVVITPIIDGNGNVERLLAISRDVTERRQTEEISRVKDSAIASSLNAMAIANLQGCLTYVNPAFLKLWGYTQESEVLGRPVVGFWQDPPQVLQVIGIIRQGQGWMGELTARRKDGGRRNLFLSASTVLNEAGAPICMMASFMDITERRRAEEELRRLNATLEVKVAQRTAELEQRSRQLQKLTLELTQAEDRERQRVAALLHEDLQQHLAAAKFHLSALKRRARGDPQFAVVGHVDTMLKEAIEKSRNLSHDLSPAMLHMNDLREVLQWLATQMQAKYGLTVHTDVHGAAALPSEDLTMFLFRAAQEMLFNVAKHAQVREAAIRVRRAGHYLYLSVTDRGCGFDPQALKQTPGFGLPSIRERIGLLGGRMKIRSTRSRGSTVVIALPRNGTSCPVGLAPNG